MAVEPKTQEMVTTAVETCPLKDLKAGPVFTHLDLGLLGESMGPDQQPRLRKRFNPDDNLLRKLIHGAMVGRGGQKNSAGECTVPAESEVVLCHISSIGPRWIAAQFSARNHPERPAVLTRKRRK